MSISDGGTPETADNLGAPRERCPSAGGVETKLIALQENECEMQVAVRTAEITACPRASPLDSETELTARPGEVACESEIALAARPGEITGRAFLSTSQIAEGF